MALIDCKNVSLSYENVTVVNNLDFKVNRGDYLCIVGENGSGKSTLMKAMLGLKGVSKGKISFGENMTSEQIGYLPQQSSIQKDFPASVKEVVFSGLLSQKKNNIFLKKSLKEKAFINMKKLDIDKIANKCYRELSGGQQQRVLLARALCAADSLILLDEPVSGLDPVVTADFYSLIEKLNREDGMTVIMVSHDILYAVSHASHILHIRKNKSFFGTAEEYRSSDIFKSFSGGDIND